MKVFRLGPLFFLSAFFALPNPSSKTGVAQVSQDPKVSPASSRVVYVTDFELDVVRRRAQKSSSAGATPVITSSATSGTAPTSPGAPSGPMPSDSSSKTSGSSASAKPVDSEADEGPTDRAKALVTAMSDNLVKALEKAGYTVHRVRGGDAPPHAGLRIRGVFAEPDEQNRIRRLLVGSDSTTPKMLLYIGVDNLARPEQPLYELAKPTSNDGKHGPVITVTSYSPVARFEMEKNPADDDLKKIATDIVADLNALLNANPTLASQ
jgi:hypothetical protein